MESAVPAISLDLLIRALLHPGVTPAELGVLMARRPSACRIILAARKEGGAIVLVAVKWDQCLREAPPLRVWGRART